MNDKSGSVIVDETDVRAKARELIQNFKERLGVPAVKRCIDLTSSICGDILKDIIEIVVSKDPFNLTKEINDITPDKPFKRKSSHVCSVRPKKSKLDSLFDSLFLPKHREDVVRVKASVNGDKVNNKNNKKLNTIFDSVLGKLNRSTEYDLGGEFGSF